MKLIGKLGLVAAGAGLAAIGAGTAMKVLGYSIVKNEEAIEELVTEVTTKAEAVAAEAEEVIADGRLTPEEATKIATEIMAEVEAEVAAEVAAEAEKETKEDLEKLVEEMATSHELKE